MCTTHAVEHRYYPYSISTTPASISPLRARQVVYTELNITVDGSAMREPARRSAASASRSHGWRRDKRKEAYNVSYEQGITHSTKRGAESSRQSGGDHQGAFDRSDHAARSLQVGNPHSHRSAGSEEWPESVRPQCVRAGSDRHAGKPLVRRAAIHHAPAAAGCAEADPSDPRRRWQCRFPRQSQRPAGETLTLSHRLHPQPGRPALHQSDRTP